MSAELAWYGLVLCYIVWWAAFVSLMASLIIFFGLKLWRIFGWKSWLPWS